MTRPALHELLMSLITDDAVKNEAESVRYFWVKSNSKEKDKPLDIISRVREELKSKNWTDTISYRKGRVMGSSNLL